MRKNITVALIVCTIGVLLGNYVLTEKALKEDLTTYIEIDMKGLSELQQEIQYKYNLIKIEGEGNPTGMGKAITEELLPTTEELLAKANEIKVDREEIQILHNMFIRSIEEYKESFELMGEALREVDKEILNNANSKLLDANESLKLYRTELRLLMEKEGITEK